METYEIFFWASIYVDTTVPSHEIKEEDNELKFNCAQLRVSLDLLVVCLLTILLKQD